MKKVLFLCSGNYYRSRFAEYLFNDLAEKVGLDWQAFSRGLVVDRPNRNIGRISPFTLSTLTALNIPFPDKLPYPQQVTEADFAAADLVIAVKESEHRPMMQARFPHLEDTVTYWGVHDLDVEIAEQSLPKLADLVEGLVRGLA